MVGDCRRASCARNAELAGCSARMSQLFGSSSQGLHNPGVLTLRRMRPKFFSDVCSFDPRVQMQGGQISALGALADPRGEFLHVIEDLSAVCHFIEDFLLGIHDRGVVTPERLADLREGQVGEFTAQIHRNLAGLSQSTGFTWSA